MDGARPGFLQRHAAVLLIVWTGSTVLLGGGTAGHLRGDALLYAAIMKQIAQTGDWLTLRIGDEPYFNKPPLMFWFGAAVFKALGTSIWVARLIGAIPGIALMLATYAVVRRLADDKRALLAAVILGTCRIFGRYAGVPRVDAPLTLCAVAAVLAILASRRDARHALLFGVAIAAGWLVKGPAGLMPIAAVAVWSLFQRRVAPWNSWRLWLGLGVLAPALIVPWYLYLGSVYGDQALAAYSEDILLNATGDRGAVLPLQKYGVDMLIEWLPWLPFVAHGMWLCVRRFRAGERDGLAAFALAWFAVYFGSVFAIRSAYTRYLFPLLPAIAIFGAESIASLFPRFVAMRLERTLAVALVCITTLAGLSPVELRSTEVPELVVLEPTLRTKGALTPIPFLTDRIGRRLQASAIVHLGTTVRAVSPDDVRAAVREKGACVALVDGWNNTPAGLTFTVLVQAGDYQVVEFRADPSQPR